MVELVGQDPALQWPRLVQCIWLLLDQRHKRTFIVSDKRSLMERIADEAAVLVSALVPGYLLTIAGDDYPVDETLHDDIAMAIDGRRRVVASAIADQRRRGDPPRLLLASFEGARWQPGGRRTDRLPAAPRSSPDDRSPCDQARPGSPLPGSRTFIVSDKRSLSVQSLEAVGDRHRRQETAAAVLDEVLDFAFIVPLTRPAEPVPEEIIANQVTEGPRPLPLAITTNPGHGQLGVIIKDR